ncbi:ArsR/SmtB family transcription factor [Haloarchaeobius litoreus]|uniref:ArsR/SmtB family transcription factor n=1 Tax=Haloarchaeobius litoreus TaxID=755306 RepID=A0ABD6DL89_9EURY|nr:helix-turn-helix domain-containing protein [Haloarchaeobius litoreus]
MTAAGQLQRRRERRDSAPAAADPPENADTWCFTATDDAASEILDLLNDEYTRRILERLSETPRPARTLIRRCDASKPTVYRRLNRLEEHGLIDVDIEFDDGGHHRKVYCSRLVSATFQLDDGSPTVQVTVDEPSADYHHNPTRRSR